MSLDPFNKVVDAQLVNRYSHFFNVKHYWFLRRRTLGLWAWVWPRILGWINAALHTLGAWFGIKGWGGDLPFNEGLSSKQTVIVQVGAKQAILSAGSALGSR